MNRTRKTANEILAHYQYDSQLTEKILVNFGPIHQ